MEIFTLQIQHSVIVSEHAIQVIYYSAIMTLKHVNNSVLTLILMLMPNIPIDYVLNGALM